MGTDSSIGVTPGVGATVRVVYNSGVDSGAYQQVVTLADKNGNYTARSATANPTNYSVTATAGTALASNTGRMGAIILNDSASASPVFVGFYSSPTTTSYSIKLNAGDAYEVPFGFTGIITAICATAGTATLRVTEFIS